MDQQPKKRDRSVEIAKRREKRIAHATAESRKKAREAEIEAQLPLLAMNTQGNPADSDGDILFAYKNMANPDLLPLQAPSPGAWAWYVYACNDPSKFLEIHAKREDAKSKQAGTITQQRMEDDKRKQFAILDRIEKQLTLDVKGIVRDLMSKFPEDVLHECRTFTSEWDAYFAKFPHEASQR